MSHDATRANRWCGTWSWIAVSQATPKKESPAYPITAPASTALSTPGQTYASAHSGISSRVSQPARMNRTGR